MGRQRLGGMKVSELNYDEGLETNLMKYRSRIMIKATEYSRKFSKSDFIQDRDDIYQAGCEGFIEFYLKYSPETKEKFWEQLWIYTLNIMHRYCRQYLSPIYVPDWCTREVQPEVDFLGLDLDPFYTEPNYEADDSFDAALRRAAYSKIRTIVEKTYMKERTKYVLTEYYGFYTGKTRTLEDIGRELGLTRERVRIILNSAVDRVKPRIRKEFKFYDPM